MSHVGERERFAQNRIVKLFTTPEAAGGLGYTYLGDWHDRPANSNLEELYLRTYLSGKYSSVLIEKAIFEFTKATVFLS